jgi:hypothetical protein
MRAVPKANYPFSEAQLTHCAGVFCLHIVIIVILVRKRFDIATLMRELGGNNLLRFSTDICKIELTRALSSEHPAPCSFDEITSKESEWFGMLTPMDNLDDRRREVHEAIESALRGLNRKDRRRRRSELDPKKKSSHATIRALIKDGLRNSPLSKIPISLMNPDLVLDWFLGTATDAEFRLNSIRLLSDPYLLFKYFIDELGHREQLYNIIRNQGLKWSEFIQIGMSQMAPLLAEAKKQKIFDRLEIDDITIDIRTLLAKSN